MLSLMFSFILSLNRVTSLYLHEKLNDKVRREINSYLQYTKGKGSGFLAISHLFE